MPGQRDMLKVASTRSQVRLDGLCLTAVSLWLATQPAMVERYEAGKSILLAMIAAALLPLLWSRRQDIQWKHPLVWMTAAGLMWAGVATLIALHPATSLWGSVYRSQGWLTLLAGSILFIGATLLSPIARQQLPIMISLVGIPLALWMWASYLDPVSGVERPVASAGNANFLANALGLATLMALGTIQRGGRWRWYGLASAALVFSALILTGSRAGFWGLLAAAVVAGLLVLALYGRGWNRRWLIGLLVGGVGTLSISLALGAGELPRQLLLDDAFRLALLQDGYGAIQQMPVPLRDMDGQADSWAALRPLSGYGLDQLERLNPRFHEGGYYIGTWIDRLHHHLMDSWLATGLVGMVIQSSVGIVALGYGLRLAGWQPTRRAVLAWLAWMGGGGVLAAGLMTVNGFAPAMLAYGIPAGTGLGFVVWLLVEGQGRSSTFQAQPESLTGVLLMAVVIHQMVFNLFHFTHTMGQVVWWLSLGMLVAAHTHSTVSQRLSLPVSIWLLPGATLLFSLGVEGVNEAALLLLSVLTLVSGGGVGRAVGTGSLRRSIIEVSGWMVTALTLHILAGYATTQGWSALLVAGLPILAGVLWLWLIVVVCGRDDLGSAMRAAVMVAIACLLYLHLWMGSALYRQAEDAAAQADPRTGDLYALAAAVHPVPGRVQLSMAWWRWRAGDQAGAEAHLRRILEADPFLSGAPDILQLQEDIQRNPVPNSLSRSAGIPYTKLSAYHRF